MPKPQAFKTVISELFLKNDSLLRFGFDGFPGEIELPFEHNELRFRYAAPVFWDESRTQYRYKLEGDSDEWSSWTKETQKDYTNLLEGDYTFIVESKDAFDEIGTSAKVAFTILPPWYRTWWAYSLYLAVFTGSLYSLYRLRIEQILKEHAIRNKISQDLHDDVSATLSSIYFFAEAARPELQTHPALRMVDLISKSASEAKDKITDIVWSIKSDENTWDEIIKKAEFYVRQLADATAITMEFNHSNSDLVLNLEQKNHLWLIFKEIITNSVRHSGCSWIGVSFLLDEQLNQITLDIQDNGKGFDIEKVRRNNGITNIEKRVAALNGSLKILASPGKGARFQITIKL